MDQTTQNPFGAAGRGAARQAWSTSRERMRTRYRNASLLQRLGSLLIFAIAIGIMLLVLIPAVIIGVCALAIGWTWIKVRRVIHGRSSPRVPGDQTLRRNVRVIRR